MFGILFDQPPKVLCHQVIPVDFIMREGRLHDFVYIIDCVWEIYIMVGCNARDHEADIEFALRIASVGFNHSRCVLWFTQSAQELSRRVSSERPFHPTVHVLLLPSQIPRDLRVNVRGLDEFALVNLNLQCTRNFFTNFHRIRGRFQIT